MKTLRHLSFALIVLGSSAATLAPPALPAPPVAQATPAGPRQWLARYHYFTATEIPALLAWLRDGGPFTRPAPGLLPTQPRSAPAWAAEPGALAPR